MKAFRLILILALSFMMLPMHTAHAHPPHDYNLDAFIEGVIENDTTRKLIDAEIDIHKDLEKQLLDQNKRLKMDHHDADSYVGLYLSLEFEPFAKRIEAEQLERKKEAHLKKLAVDAHILYLRHQYAEKYEEFSKFLYHKSLNDLKVQSQAVENGVASTQSLKAYEDHVKQTLAAYERAKLDFDVSQMKVNHLLNLPLDTKIHLSETLPAVSTLDFNALQIDANQTEAVIQAKERLQLAEKKHAIFTRRMWNHPQERDTTVYMYGFPTQWSHVKKELVDAKTHYDKTFREEQYRLHTLVNQRKQVALNSELASLKLEKATLAKNAADVKLELGHITPYEHAVVVYELAMAEKDLTLQQLELTISLLTPIN